MKKNFLFVIIFIANILNIYGDYYDGFIYNDNYGNHDNINVVSISYELTYNNYSVVKVTIKAYDEIVYNINFNAYLKSDDKNKYALNCSNFFYDTIECLSEPNISIDTSKKYYFYYEKGEKDKITFDGKTIYEDNKKISLIFKPEVAEDQLLFKDHKKIDVKTDMEMVGGGYLYLVRKSKKILQKPKCGFNKYIELNNFIPHCGLMGYRPQSTLVAYEEAIRRGYHIVDADLIFTKDKIPVINHGDDIEQYSNGKGKISSKTLEELEELDFGEKFDKKYKGEKILTFEKLLELCKENDVIIDLDLAHLQFGEYFNSTNGYLKKIFDLIEKYDMFDSIFFNERRPEAILKLKEIKNDISFAVAGMNEKQNIEKIKDEYKDSKRIIYSMGGLMDGLTIKEDVVKYGLSLGKKIKAAKVDDIAFAEKIQSWGVNYITTNLLHPFLIKNEKEDPIVVRCSPSVIDEHESDCEIRDDVKLIDNEKYDIYYSENIYNISEDINEMPIGEFEYIDTNILDELYYSIIKFSFEEGIIILNTTNKVKKGEEILGVVGPAYDNVAECYQYNFVCRGNNTRTVKCIIEKNYEDKVKFNGTYKIYSLEGYSYNPEEVMRKLNLKKIRDRFYAFILIAITIAVICIIIFYIIRQKKIGSFREIKIAENTYLPTENLFR